LKHRDNKLIQRIIDGDKSAFEQIVIDYQKLVYSLCFKFMKNAEDAEDMSQEVFITIYKNLHGFRLESSLSTWIYRICVNSCLNKLKLKNKYKTEELQAYEEVYNGPGPVEVVESNEGKESIVSEIDKLKDKAREIVKLRLLDEKTFVEIADILKIPVSSARTSFTRSKAHLRQKIMSFRKE
jgi:RNA polymerase sigma-70 factor, ECF subfamily